MRSANPFRYSGPITDPDGQIRRDAAVRAVSRHVLRNEYVSVMAPPQTDKTTLLSTLHKTLKNSTYLDLGGRRFTDCSEVIAAIGCNASANIGSQFEAFRPRSAADKRVYLLDE